MNILKKIEKELFPEGRKPEPPLLEFYNCLKDAKTSFEVFHFFESWKMDDVQLLKMHARKISDFTVDAGGRDTYKTTTAIEMIREKATTCPYDKAIYVVKGDTHLVTMQDEMEKVFNVHPYLKLIKGNWNKKDRVFKFDSNFILYTRILGADITGESKAQAAHVSLIIIDEAELASADLIKNLMHALLPDAQLWVTGVVNDDRTSALFSPIKKENFLYLRFASHECGNWTAQKERIYLEEYGSKQSKGWRNQIEGYWNEPAFSVIPEEDIDACIDDSPKFRILHDRLDVKNASDFADIIRFNFLPEILEPEYYSGMDVGDQKAESEILIGALIRETYAGTKNEKIKSKKKKVILHRISINRVLGNQLTVIIDYILNGYGITRGAMDAHVVGRPYYESLLQEPYLSKNYKEIMFPYIEQGNIRTGWVQDKERPDKFKEEQQQQKHFATMRLAGEFMQRNYLIPKEDCSVLRKSVLGEHAIRRVSAKYPIYENYYSNLEHLFDALRALELAFWYQNEYPYRPELDEDEEDDEIVLIDWGSR